KPDTDRADARGVNAGIVAVIAAAQRPAEEILARHNRSAERNDKPRLRAVGGGREWPAINPELRTFQRSGTRICPLRSIVAQLVSELVIAWMRNASERRDMVAVSICGLFSPMLVRRTL